MGVENYIVRIYRRGRNKVLVGVVEAAESGWQKPFRNVTELVDIFAAPKQRSGTKGRSSDKSPMEESEDITRSYDDGKMD